MNKYLAFVLIITLRIFINPSAGYSEHSAFSVPKESKKIDFQKNWREDKNYQIYRSIYIDKSEYICYAPVRK